MLFNDLNRLSFKLSGKITALAPISVTRPDDNFMSFTGTAKKPRLPRAGAKQDKTMPFVPGSSLRGGLRRSMRDVVRDLTGEQLSIETAYMLTQGVDITNLMMGQKKMGSIGLEEPLRLLNPALSLFGAWQLPGHLGVSDMFPDTADCLFSAGGGVRTNDFVRDPTQIQFLNKGDVEKLEDILINDVAIGSEINELQASIKNINKRIREEKDKEIKAQLKQEVDHIEATINVKKSEKTGSKEQIQRPLEGYEAIVPGTQLHSALPLNMVNRYEMGLFLESLSRFAKSPVIGGHKNHACGYVSGQYSLSHWPLDADSPQLMATITFDEEGFRIEGDAAQELQKLRSEFKDLVKSGKFDFTAYLFSQAA
jgi:hypothetical protein